MEPRRNNHQNHFNNQPLDRVLNSRTQENRSARPDDRPIAFNPAGKYNLDFIDWDNEFEAICGGLEPMNQTEDQIFPGYNIPEGVSQETFAAMISQMQESNEEDLREGLPPEILKRVKKMIMGKSGKECSVCYNGFNQGEMIRKLPCNHIFHDQCLMPWLKKNTTCPNCRNDILTFFNKDSDMQNK